MDNLKPCAFCRGVGEVFKYWPDSGDPEPEIAVSCSNCGVVMYERNEVSALDQWNNQPLRAWLRCIMNTFIIGLNNHDSKNKGMHVPYTGDFASAYQLPSFVQSARWWIRKLKKILGEEDD